MLLEYLTLLPQNRYSNTRKLVLVIFENMRLHLVNCRIFNQLVYIRTRIASLEETTFLNTTHLTIYRCQSCCVSGSLGVVCGRWFGEAG